MQFVLLSSILLIGIVNGRGLKDYILACPKNELYVKCPSINEASCKNPVPIPVNLENLTFDGKPVPWCTAGCQCAEGFLRRADKKCVKPIDCDTIDQCGENESFESCGSGCEPSCENLVTNLLKTPTNCTRECVAGCQCDKGFVRRGDNKCVLYAQCPLYPPPPKCPENEIVDDCHKCSEKACPVWGRNGFHLERSECLSRCTKGCICNKGLFRNHEGRCVKEADCAPPGHECKENETFKRSGFKLGCEPSCRTPNMTCVDKLPKIGCNCKTGFMRNPEGECVKQANCPPHSQECKENETFKIRRPACEPSCRTPNNIVCIAHAKLDCHCNTGFLRNPEGKCVKEADCPYEDPENKCKSVECENGDSCFINEGRPFCVPQYFLLRSTLDSAPEDGKCNDNEIFSNCKTSCSNTECNEEPKTCPDVCNGSGCVCREGFFRNQFGYCITQKGCSEQGQFFEYLLSASVSRDLA